MKKINFHTHTELCKHAQGTELDYVEEALQQKLDRLGFSDHAAYPDDRYGLRMDYCELLPHIDRLKKLKSKYSNELEIFIGLEIEYDSYFQDYYRLLLNKYDVEYLLLGQHLYNNKNGENFNTYFIEQEQDTYAYIDYANSLKDGMETGFFKAIAHPDLIFINNLPYDENAEKACQIIIEAAKNTGIILEFNANGIRRGKAKYFEGIRYPYPYMPFWEMVSKEKIPVIINSDCHEARKLWDDAVEKSYCIAKDLSLNLVDHIFI